MRGSYSRRDFLKLSGLLSFSVIVPLFMRSVPPRKQAPAGKKNVLVVVFDAFSAYHLSFHGYGRETTPNLGRWIERAVVYHNHYSGGNYSTPGTASLLTGVHPWRHRAFEFNSIVSEDYADKTIFHAFDEYYRIAYSHNSLVNTLLEQFASDLEDYIPLEQFLLTNERLVHSLFHNDYDIATVSWSRETRREEGYSYSLFLASLYEKYLEHKTEEYVKLFPRGVPRILEGSYFVLEDVIEALGKQLRNTPKPFLGYFHFLPPHLPYKTQRDFYNFFENDKLPWTYKPKDIFVRHNGEEPQFLMRRRQEYDEFILYVDREFGKFMDHLESTGLLDDTWVVLTSDHGELFERGILGHTTEVLYQSIVRIPLIIFEPGRKTRADVYTQTSAVDVLPTLLHVTGGQKPDWAEGIILPPFSIEAPEPQRSVYVMEARNTGKHSPITRGTFIMVKGQYKLMYFFGYEILDGKERIELYNIDTDHEELKNLYPSQSELGDRLLLELKSKLAEVNKPYL